MTCFLRHNHSAQFTVLISLRNTNAPSVTVSKSMILFTEQGSPVAVAASATIDDVDYQEQCNRENVSSLTVQLVEVYDGINETLRVSEKFISNQKL